MLCTFFGNRRKNVLVTDLTSGIGVCAHQLHTVQQPEKKRNTMHMMPPPLGDGNETVHCGFLSPVLRDSMFSTNTRKVKITLLIDDTTISEIFSSQRMAFRSLSNCPMAGWWIQAPLTLTWKMSGKRVLVWTILLALSRMAMMSISIFLTLLTRNFRKNRQLILQPTKEGFESISLFHRPTFGKSSNNLVLNKG